jgi:hypothetical protein
VAVLAALVLVRAFPAVAADHTLELRSEQVLPGLYNQGVARVPGGWVVSGTSSPVPGTDVLARLDEQLQIQVLQNVPIPATWRAAGYAHVGDIDVVGNVLYAPYEQPTYELGHQAMARYDATTLEFLDAREVPQHENSFVAVDAGIAYTMDRFDGQELLRYDVARDWKPLAPLHLSRNLVHTQGADIARGAIWISTSDPHNDIYRVDLATGQTDLVGRFGHDGGEGEGLDTAALGSGTVHGLVTSPNHLQIYLQHFGERDAPPASHTRSASGAPSASGSPGGAGAASNGGGGSGLAVTGGYGLLPVAAGVVLVAALTRHRRRRRA